MSFKNYLVALNIAQVDTSDFVGFGFINYYNANGLPQNCVILRVTNNSNIAIDISFDGGEQVHDIVLAGQSLQIYAQTNNPPSSHAAFFRKGIQISSRASLGAAGMGFINLGGFYVPQGD